MIKLLIISLWFFLFHPVHVTLTSIDYLPEKGTYKVFVRLYFDDFLLDCKLKDCDKLNHDFSTDDKLSQGIVEQYLAEKIVIKVNGKELSGKLEKIDLTDNELSINLSYNSVNDPGTLTVKNLIMTDLYSDQSNMIIVRIDEFEEGVKLTSVLTEQTFIIK
jgi:predicted RNA-binding protein